MNSTSPFRFKQFTVEQTRAAMKVGLDGILLDAWANVCDCHRILDVGTGTGLVALMPAQRSDEGTMIEAIDNPPNFAGIESSVNEARSRPK